MKNKIHPFVMESIWGKKYSPEERSKYGLDQCGWGNGYVKIPPGHPWYGVHYENIDPIIDIHGGLTYSDWVKPGYGATIEEENKNWWIIGFDTRHGGDTPFDWSDVHVMHEAIRLAKQAEEAWNDKIEQI